jgi:hypothetical protein
MSDEQPTYSLEARENGIVKSYPHPSQESAERMLHAKSELAYVSFMRVLDPDRNVLYEWSKNGLLKPVAA